jgi:hypothetical protein
MSAVDCLVAADRIVLAGLSAYDAAMARAWEKAASDLAGAGYSADEVAEAAEGHRQRTLASRGKLHRELWTNALAHLAVLGPQGAD